MPRSDCVRGGASNFVRIDARLEAEPRDGFAGWTPLLA